MNKEYLLGLYEKAMPNELSWKEKMLAARESGYDFIEISVDETDEKLRRLDMPKEERWSILRLSEEMKMPIRSMCLSGHRKFPLGSHDENIRRRSLEIMEKACELADDLGVRIIQLAGYDVYYEESDAETLEHFSRNLKKCTEIAAKHGVMLGFETMETPFMDTVKKSMKYVRQMDSPYLHVYPDLGNLTNAAVLYREDLYEDIRAGAGRIIAMHLKETVPGEYRNRHYGDGHVNFEKGIDLAWKMGVRRFVTEFWYLGDENWMEELKQSRKMMGDILDRVCPAPVGQVEKRSDKGESHYES